MKTQLSRETLFNYFAGRSTALEKQLIDEWAKDNHNREIFFDYLAIWESQNPQFTVDANAAFQKHQERVMNRNETDTFETDAPEGSGTDQVSPGSFFWMIAAAVAFILVFCGIYFKDHVIYRTYEATFGETRSLELSDGSLVTLNANSCLRVPRFNFGRKSRRVILTGEADFSIKHMPDHQNFVVQTNKNFEVVVLGTEFMVNTREKSRKVVLNKGKVRLLYNEGESKKELIMKPGNLVTFDNEGHANLQQPARPKDFTAWKEHRFIFDGTTLADLSNLFADNYGIKLKILDKELSQWTISGAFTAYSATELMESLASTSNLTYRQKGDTIVVTQGH